MVIQSPFLSHLLFAKHIDRSLDDGCRRDDDKSIDIVLILTKVPLGSMMPQCLVLWKGLYEVATST
jgi:hypothetical protein